MSSSITAVYVTILFCADGTVSPGSACKDGSIKQAHNVSIISRPIGGGKETLFEYDENGVPKFTLYPDGSIRRAGDFNVDDVALSFWQAIANVYKDACPSLSSVLDGVPKGQP
jgi:hypothetical protein